MVPPYTATYVRGLPIDIKNKIKFQIVEQTKMFIRTYGVKLIGDGWNLVNNYSLLNMMCAPSANKEFLEAINTLGHMKDRVYIADVIKRYLIEVGPQNVLQICMDSASVVHKAISIV